MSVDISQDKPGQYGFPTRARAMQVGKAILKLMGGSNAGWKIRVHENMGWHVSLRKGCISLYHRNFNGASKYSTLMGIDPKSGGGEMYLTERTKEFITPMGAYLHQLKVAHDHLKAVERALEVSS